MLIIELPKARTINLEFKSVEWHLRYFSDWISLITVSFYIFRQYFFTIILFPDYSRIAMAETVSRTCS